MDQLVINTDEDVDILIKELTRLQAALPEGKSALTWKTVCEDSQLLSMYEERLAAVMGAAKRQKAIAYEADRLIQGEHEEVVIELMDGKHRIRGEKGAVVREKQQKRFDTHKKNQSDRVEARRNKIAEQKKRAKPIRATKTGTGGVVEEVEEVEEIEEVEESEEDEEDAGPPPPGDDDSDGDGPPPPGDEDEEEDPGPPPPADDDDDGPPPPPAEDEDDDGPPPPPPEADDDDPPPPPAGDSDNDGPPPPADEEEDPGPPPPGDEDDDPPPPPPED